MLVCNMVRRGPGPAGAAHGRRAGVVAMAAALLIGVAGGRPAGGLDADDVVRKVQERYDATRDFTADVTQEMTVASLGKTMTAHGTLAFKRPGKLRLELKDEEPQIVVADGRTLWFYQPAENQVLKAPFEAAFRSTTPISFLTGVGRIADDFTAQLSDVGAADPATLTLTLTPRTPKGDLEKLRLTVARDNFEIRGAEIHDPLGNVSRLRFEHIRPNTGLDEDRFVFQVPPGVDVLAAPLGE